jgi:protein-S-isoprenylcysteine O-methyltransferase Ste14
MGWFSFGPSKEELVDPEYWRQYSEQCSKKSAQWYLVSIACGVVAAFFLIMSFAQETRQLTILFSIEGLLLALWAIVALWTSRVAGKVSETSIRIAEKLDQKRVNSLYSSQDDQLL